MALNCPVCGNLSKFESHHPETKLYRCPDCDHCFSDTNSILEYEQYDLDYYEVTHRNWFLNPNLDLFELVYRFIKNQKTDATVLDIGCGKGQFLKYLYQKDSNLSLHGIDLSTNDPTEGIEFMKGDVLSLKLEKQFDVVTSLAVIEHVADVKEFVKRLYELCVPGGLVIIMTLNDRGTLYGLSRLLNRMGYSSPFERLYSKHHVHHFNKASLKKLLEINSFSVLEVVHHNVPLAAVDFTASSPLAKAVLKAGVFGTFVIGRIAQRAYLQTMVARRG